MSATPQPALPQCSPKLFLAPRQGSRPKSILERLANFFRLYGYGRANMTEMVRVETERAALVLSAIFLFDVWGWSLVWNAIFHRGALEIDHRTLWAVTLGVIFAIVVISFEQGIITMSPRIRTRGFLITRRFKNRILNSIIAGAQRRLGSFKPTR